MGEGQRKPRNRNETQPSKRVPGQGRRAGEPDTVLSGERQDVSLPSKGSRSIESQLSPSGGLSSGGHLSCTCDSGAHLQGAPACQPHLTPPFLPGSLIPKPAAAQGTDPRRIRSWEEHGTGWPGRHPPSCVPSQSCVCVQSFRHVRLFATSRTVCSPPGLCP